MQTSFYLTFNRPLHTHKDWSHEKSLCGRKLQFDINDIIDPSLQGICGSLGIPPCEDDIRRQAMPANG